ncbi:MAG: hypothetical protein GKR91_00455 [Pseudomonadales bacterium]|nr:hypothetical protein [Pseudomonadales bacterium]
MTDTISIRRNSLDTKYKLIKLSALVITVFNLLGIAFSVYTFSTLHDTLDARSGADLLQQIRDDFAGYEEIEKDARANMSIIRQMDGSIDLEVSEKQILATASFLHNSEKDFQLFYRLLKVNIYHLTGEIPGSMSWYEIYGPEIDQAIERSRTRQLQLLRIQEFYGKAV